MLVPDHLISLSHNVIHEIARCLKPILTYSQQISNLQQGDNASQRAVPPRVHPVYTHYNRKLTSIAPRPPIRLPFRRLPLRLNLSSRLPLLRRSLPRLSHICRLFLRSPTSCKLYSDSFSCRYAFLTEVSTLQLPLRPSTRGYPCGCNSHRRRCWCRPRGSGGNVGGGPFPLVAASPPCSCPPAFQTVSNRFLWPCNRIINDDLIADTWSTGGRRSTPPMRSRQAFPPAAVMGGQPPRPAVAMGDNDKLPSLPL